MDVTPATAENVSSFFSFSSLFGNLGIWEEGTVGDMREMGQVGWDCDTDVGEMGMCA